MRNLHHIALLLTVVCLVLKNVKSSSASLPKLNLDILPRLEEVLRELELDSYLMNFVKYGITDTRYLLRLTRMDFQLMELEWKITKEELNSLRDKIAELISLATITEHIAPVVNHDRKILRYGRLAIPNSVQSFEFMMASFGGDVPLGPQHLCLPDEFYGCESLGSSHPGSNITGCIHIVARGGCSFLQKAQLAKSLGASGVAIVNSEDRIEAYSSGFGVVPNVSEVEVLRLAAFPVFSLANTSIAKLTFSLKHSPDNRLMAYTVPLKCGIAARCEAVTAEERALPLEVAGGKLLVHRDNNTAVFDFMTSVFGGALSTDLVHHSPSYFTNEITLP